MGATYKGVTVKVGDRITVQAQGIAVTGTVVTADHYGEEDGWYIQMTDANVPGGFSYWKQGFDGGRITHINGKEVK
jgi:hypothetical protein